MTTPNSMYGDAFYDGHMEGSYRSAQLYAECLSKVYSPGSVVDVGCGRGAWLKAFKESGARRLLGFDGVWNSQQMMIEASVAFKACDLNKPILADERFDLAMSLEVAEHLEPASSVTFVSSLVGLSDVVMFGAAFIEQGGTNHVNEQRNSFWARLFASHGYVVFDIFRPVFWGDSRVESWYQQNTFLYVRKGSSAMTTLTSKGLSPMSSLGFMDCLHPDLYLHRNRSGSGLSRYVQLTVDALKLAMKRRKEPVRPELAGNKDMTERSNA
jgi:hypothetical protein